MGQHVHINRKTLETLFDLFHALCSWAVTEVNVKMKTTLLEGGGGGENSKLLPLKHFAVAAYLNVATDFFVKLFVFQFYVRVPKKAFVSKLCALILSTPFNSFSPRVKPWVIQSFFLTFDSMDRKCDHSLESC